MAPLTELQEKVMEEPATLAPLAGEDRVGVAGGLPAVPLMTLQPAVKALHP